LLSQSYTEQAAYDFKQGFFSLGDDPSFDEANFAKILKTLVGISNLGRDRIGYVLVGISETPETTARVELKFGVTAKSFESFWITGIDHETVALKKTADQLFQYIVDRVRKSDISEPLRSYIASNIKPVRYYDKTVYVFEAKGMPEPSLYKTDYYVRTGAQLEKLESANLSSLFRRYLI
jgi:predicted HTH transcriptional regulator